MNDAEPTPDRARPDWALRIAMLLVAISATVPFWVSDLLPFMDLPQHLSAIRVLHSLDDPAYGVSAFHYVDLGRTQYLLYYLFTDALTSLMPLEVANRVALSLYALGVPLSIASYARAHGRDPAIGLLAGPFVFNTFLFMGFANYVTGIPFMFWGLALLRTSMTHFRWRQIAGLVILTLALFYSHAQLYLIYGLMAGLTGLFGGRGLHPRNWWRQFLHLLPSLGLMAVWALGSKILATDADWQAGHGGRNVSPSEVRFEPFIDRLAALPRQLLDAYPSDGDEWVLLIVIALLTIAALTRGSDPTSSPDAPSAYERIRPRLPELFAALMLLIYIASPISYRWIWPISHRLVPIVALFALVAFAPRHRPNPRRLTRLLTLIVPATLLMMGAANLHSEKAQAFTEEAGPIRSILAKAEPRKKVLGLIFDRGSRVVHHAPYIHFAQYYVVEHGGAASFSFAEFPQSPVLYHPENAPPRLPNRFEWTPERFNLATHGGWYDYFLVRDGGPERPRTLFARHKDSVELVAREGQWALYKKRDTL